MAQLLILTSAVDTEVLPALGLLSHTTKQIPASPASLISAPTCDLIFVDARQDLASAKSLCCGCSQSTRCTVSWACPAPICTGTP